LSIERKTPVTADERFDVGIVGAGPAGATCAYYLALGGARVLLLDKERFPREKLCGDAVCSPAHKHLRRMGVLQAIEAQGLGNWACVGGLISPGGVAMIGNSTGDHLTPMVIAIRRMVLDEMIVRAAAAAGAELVEEFPVGAAEFSAAEGLWTIHHRYSTRPPFRVKALVAADGANSRLARALGIVHAAPDAICSRVYVDAGSTNFDADGVLYYPRALLPGYCALFREARGLLSYCCYIIPGGVCRMSDVKRMHFEMPKTDPHLRRAMGPNPRMEQFRAAPLRTGGIPRPYGHHLLILGDAAGQIDPLTGEGIHYAMEAAEMAADVLIEALHAGNLSAAQLRDYHRRWQRAYGRDFAWSARMARLCARYPVLLDAAAALGKRRGVRFLRDWGEAMTGATPKSSFLRPNIVFPLLREAVQQLRS
jgi:geranylgeranyl reductase family protein